MMAELGQRGDGRDWEGMEGAGVQMRQAKGGLCLDWTTMDSFMQERQMHEWGGLCFEQTRLLLL